MAAISTILGGALGFFVAVIGFFLFHLTVLQALSLWSGTGLATLVTLTVLAHLPRVASPVRA